MDSRIKSFKKSRCDKVNRNRLISILILHNQVKKWLRQSVSYQNNKCIAILIFLDLENITLKKIDFTIRIDYKANYAKIKGIIW